MENEHEHVVTSEDPLGAVNGENTKFELAHLPIPGTVQIEGLKEGEDFTVTGNILVLKHPPNARPLATYKRR